MPNANWSNPTLTSTYTNFVSEVKNRDEDLALQFDGTTSTNLPTNTIRWNSSVNRWQKWSGTAWGELTATYALTALSTTGNANIGGTLGVTGAATLSSTLGVTGAITGSSTVSGTALIPTAATVPANGVYLPAANSVAISTNSTARLTIDSSGNVGIGASSPSSLLHLAGSSAQDLRIQRTGSISSAGETYGAINFVGLTSGGIAPADFSARILATHDGSQPSTTRASVLSFYTNLSSANASEKMRIDSSGRLLVGTSSARTNIFGTVGPLLQVEGTSTASQVISHTYNETSNGGPYFALIKTRSGSIGGTTVVASNDQLGAVSFLGADGSAPIEAARIQAFVDGTPGTNDMPGRLVFFTTSDGASSPTERMRIDGLGRLLVGTSVANQSFGGGTTVGVQVEHTGNSNKNLLRLVSNASANWPAVFSFARSRGTTSGAVNAIALNDSLGVINWAGADGTGFIPAAYIQAAVDGAPGTNSMPSRLMFGTTASGASTETERMRIDSSGRLLVGITSANTSGAKLQTVDGITFPATQVASADANTLDDYEEGTFTPTIVGTGTAGTGTYSVQVGRYTKIGHRVYFQINLTWSAHTGTTNMIIGALPFTSANVTDAFSTVAIRHSNLTSPASTVVQGYVNNNATTIVLESVAVAGGAAAALAIDTAATLTVAGHYEVA